MLKNTPACLFLVCSALIGAILGWRLLGLPGAIPGLLVTILAASYLVKLLEGNE